MIKENFQTYLTEPEAEAKSAKKQGLWELLASMKLAIWILVALGILSVVALFVNELRPQEVEGMVRGNWDSPGRALMTIFQMSDPFRSWWYRLLLAILCLSLFACVIERSPVIWRLWSKKPPEDDKWLKHVRTGIVRDVKVSREHLLARFGMGWTWRLKTDKLWVAEHGRAGMWGPLLMHVGMLLIVMGALVGSFGGTDVHLGGYAGDLVQTPDMPFAVRVDSFRVRYYPLQPSQWVQVDGSWVGKLDRQQADGMWLVREFGEDREMAGMTPVPAARLRNQFNSEMDRANIKRFSSFVTILENDRAVGKTEIAVNSPLRRAGFRLYQSSYEPDKPRFHATYDAIVLLFTDSLTHKTDSLTLQPFVETALPGDTLHVKAMEYLPQFKLGQGGAYSESAEPINPAISVQFTGPHGFNQLRWLFLKFPPQGSGPGRFTFRLSDIKNPAAVAELKTVFEIKRSHGSGLLWAGFAFCTLGLLLCFYVYHRVLYVQWPDDAQAKARLTGLSRKTAGLFARQLDHLLEKLT